MVTNHAKDFTTCHIGQHLCDRELYSQALMPISLPPPQSPALEQSLLATLAHQVKTVISVMQGLQ